MIRGLRSAVAALAFAACTCAGAGTPEIALSPEQRAWLAAHPTLRLGLSREGWPPFDIVTADGGYSGITAEYVTLLQRRLGFRVEVVVKPSWKAVLEGVRRGDIDMLGSISRTPEREAMLSFTEPYIATHPVVVTRRDQASIHSEQDLAGKRIAVERGYAMAERLQGSASRATPVVAPNTAQAMRLVSSGQADAYVGDLLTASFVIEQGLLSNLEVRADAESFKTDDLRFAVRKDRPQAAAILQRGVASFTEDDHRAIRRHWVHTDLPSTDRILLSDRERAWIRQHPVIRLGVESTRAPLDFVDSAGNHAGLSADYLRMAASRLGLHLELVPGLTWKQVLDGVRARRVDLVSGVVHTPEREQYMGFSAPYFFMPWVIIGRPNTNVGSDLASLHGRTVAMVQSYFVFERLAADHPTIRVLTTATEAESLEAVAGGDADAAISQLAVAQPLLTDNYLGRLRVIAAVDQFKEGLRFGVRSDWPELVALLDKALAGMSQAEQEQIQQRWLTIRIQRGVDWWAIAKVAVPAGVCLLAVIAIVLVANRRLRRAERAVSDQLAFVNAIVDTYPSPVFYKDPQGRYLGCNRAYEAAFGVTSAELRNKTVLDLGYLSLTMRQKLHDDDLALLAERGTLHDALHVTFADGSEHDTLYWKTTFDLSNGKVGGMLGVLVDITVQKQQEAALAEARDLAEAATRSKSAFLAAMSHEIRTPMNGILGMLEILGLSPLDAEQTQAVGTIQDSARALLRIIDDILDFSKIEAGRLTLEAHPVDLCEVLESTAQLFVSNARGKGLSLRCFVDAGIRRAVKGDSLRLRQIFSNLLSNAIKFTPHGSITLAADVLDQQSDSMRVRIRVTDTGIGVSKENQKLLFQPFVQAESSTSRRFGGTGLGLTISLRLVEIMNGRIEMESTEGAGTSMIVTLSLDLAHEQLLEPRGERLQGLRLLLITADADEEHYYPAYFRFWGCDVRVLHNAQEATAMGGESVSAFDVILCSEATAERIRTEIADRLQPARAPWKPHFVVPTDNPTVAALKVEGDTVRTAALQRARLIGAVAIAAGRASPEVEATRSVASVAGSRIAPSVEEAAAQRRLILLAEDHPVNQQVILRQLNLLGFAAELAENGKVAFEKWKSGRYALLLTDCHMPEMDGYQLARAIRTTEKASGLRTPIVALTANALQGEADRCLEAGMDDCLTKPVDMKTILERLQKWMPAMATATTSAAPVVGDLRHANDAPLDPAALADMFGDDHAAIRGVLGDFLDSSERDVSELTVAMDARDADHLMRTAHRIKGAARIIGAGALADASHQIELAGRNKDLSHLEELRGEFLSSLNAVARYIRAQ